MIAADPSRRLLAQLVDLALLGVLALATVGVKAVLDAIGLDALKVLVDVAFGVLVIWYETRFVAVHGATLGKRVAGIRVVSAATGARPGYEAAMLRLLVQGIGLVLFVVGLIAVWVSPFLDSSGRRQGWHDRTAGTMVVPAQGS